MAILFVRMTIIILRVYVVLLISGQSHTPSQPVYVNSGLGAPPDHMAPSKYSSSTTSSTILGQSIQSPINCGFQAQASALLPQS